MNFNPTLYSRLNVLGLSEASRAEYHLIMIKPRGRLAKCNLRSLFPVISQPHLLTLFFLERTRQPSIRPERHQNAKPSHEVSLA